MELRCSTPLEEFVVMHKKIKTTNYLQEEEKIHDFPSTPVAWGTKLEDAPKVAEKQYYNASNDIGEKTSQMEEHQKTLLQEFEVYDKTLKALQDQVVNLRYGLCGSLLMDYEGYAQSP